MFDSSSIPHNPTFVAMYNIIHIDEKWFYMTKKNLRYTTCCQMKKIQYTFVKAKILLQRSCF